jgi:hypothetical protein
MSISKMTQAFAVTAFAALSLCAAPAAQAQSNLNPVVGCEASGNKQVGGAVLGALLGAAVGNSVAKHDRGTGTAVGAVLGAGTGSVVGCKMQKNDAKALSNQNESQGYGHVYHSDGMTLASYVQPARFNPIQAPYVARTTVNLRAAPSVNAQRTGQLYGDQTFEAMASAQNGRWILVGRNGVGIGYVRSDFVSAQGSNRYGNN